MRTVFRVQEHAAESKAFWSLDYIATYSEEKPGGKQSPESLATLS